MWSGPVGCHSSMWSGLHSASRTNAVASHFNHNQIIETWVTSSIPISLSPSSRVTGLSHYSSKDCLQMQFQNWYDGYSKKDECRSYSSIQIWDIKYKYLSRILLLCDWCPTYCTVEFPRISYFIIISALINHSFGWSLCPVVHKSAKTMLFFNLEINQTFLIKSLN